jgi:DnaJ-class molecular chaperone
MVTCAEAHMKTCPDCNGDGVIERGTDDERQCPTCGGSGFVPDDDGHEEVIKTSPLERESGRFVASDDDLRLIDEVAP